MPYLVELVVNNELLNNNYVFKIARIVLSLQFNSEYIILGIIR